MKVHVGSFSNPIVNKHKFNPTSEKIQNTASKIFLTNYKIVEGIERNRKCNNVGIKNLKNNMIINLH